MKTLQQAYILYNAAVSLEDKFKAIAEIQLDAIRDYVPKDQVWNDAIQIAGATLLPFIPEHYADVAMRNEIVDRLRTASKAKKTDDADL